MIKNKYEQFLEHLYFWVNEILTQYSNYIFF